MVKKFFQNERNRAYVYRVLLAVGALVAGYGLLTSEELALWLGVAIALLNIMPTTNTSTKVETPPTSN